MAYIYRAEIYCDDCGKAIRQRLTDEDKAPADPDENNYDSDNYPKHASNNDEADTPQHCGSHEHCINAIEIEDSKMGFLFGELTRDGIDYVEDAIIDANHDGVTWCKEIVELWYRYYAGRGYRFRIAPNWIDFSEL